VGLGSVTNDAQTKAAIVPNTAPAKGSLLVGNSGSTAYDNLAVGANTYVLTADSTQTDGVKWAASGGGGPTPLATSGQGYMFNYSNDPNLFTGTQQNAGVVNRLFGGQFVASASMTPTKAIVRIMVASGTSCTGGTCGAVLACYDAPATTLLATSNAMISGGTPDLNTLGWHTFTFPSPPTFHIGVVYNCFIDMDSTALTFAIGGGGYTTFSTLDAITSTDVARIGYCSNLGSGDGSSITPPSSCGTLNSIPGYMFSIMFVP
jgi:hypothetical protein